MEIAVVSVDVVIAIPGLHDSFLRMQEIEKTA
jgi:hypothetical protein